MPLPPPPLLTDGKPPEIPVGAPVVTVPPEPRANVPVAPPVVTAPKENQPIKDQEGRIHYIVDLRDDATKDYPNINPPQDKFPEYHKPKMRHLLKDMEKQYALNATGLTSWVANSFSAYLTPDQVEKLKKDKRVTLVTQDSYAEYSSVWSDSSYYGETTSWGTTAVGGGKASNNYFRVYVLDAGVGYHVDLPNVIERVSVNTTPYINIPVVGCYAHATHVAGIIAAPRNYLGVIGVDAGAQMVSVGLGQTVDSAANCSSYPVTTTGSGPSVDSMSKGLDLIYSKLQQWGGIGIVNISIAGSVEFNTGRTLGNKLQSLATPAPWNWYAGAFIAQSAGNGYQDACGYAYNGRNTNDGIMVVGALDSNGQPVVPLNGKDGFRNEFGNETGSNYGSCVEVWAPGNKIYSTWSVSPSIPPAAPQYQSGSVTYSNYTNLSGTSMSAPFITGLAAYLAETQYIWSPSQIEQAVRAKMFPLGSSDKNSIPVSMPNLDGYRATATPTAEFLINNLVNGRITTYSDRPFTLRYDSTGAQNCNLTGWYWNGVQWLVWYSVPNFQTAYDWLSVTLTPNTYGWTVDCVSLAGLRSSAYATAVVLAPPPLPTVDVYVNGARANGQSLNIGSAASYTFNYSSTGANANSCNVTANYKRLNEFHYNTLYYIPGYHTSYNFGALTPPYRQTIYHWIISCANARDTTTAEAWITVQ